MVDAVVTSLGSSVNPWGYVLLFLLTLLEASAFVGLFIPGETALIIGGVLAARGELRLWLVIFWAVLGAILGDSIGYEIGRHFGPRLRATRLGRKLGEERWEKAHAYVRRLGGKAIFLGRFVGLLRALVPAVAGSSRMPYKRFLFWNVLGALVAAPAVIVAGYVANASYKKLEQSLGRGSLVLGALVLGGWLVWHLRHRERVADE
jgi:membrane protein DedA with SNARE-associated domain